MFAFFFFRGCKITCILYVPQLWCYTQFQTKIITGRCVLNTTLSMYFNMSPHTGVYLSICLLLLQPPCTLLSSCLCVVICSCYTLLSFLIQGYSLISADSPPTLGKAQLGFTLLIFRTQTQNTTGKKILCYTGL